MKSRRGATYTTLRSLGKPPRELGRFGEMLSCLIWLNLSPNRAGRGPTRGMQPRWRFAPCLQVAGAQSQKTTLLRLPALLPRSFPGPELHSPGGLCYPAPRETQLFLCVFAELMPISGRRAAQGNEALTLPGKQRGKSCHLLFVGKSISGAWK